MRKNEAIDLFGGEVKGLAEALNVSPQAVSQWADTLSERQIKEVIGAGILKYGVEKVRAAFPKLRIKE